MFPKSAVYVPECDQMISFFMPMLLILNTIGLFIHSFQN